MNNQVPSVPAELRGIESALAVQCAVGLEVDARNLACPLPLLKAKQGLRTLAVDELIRVLATDAGSLKDFVSFAQLTGQELAGFYQADGYYCFVIRKR